MGEEAVLNSRNKRRLRHIALGLDRHKPWFHITLGVILALALTATINLLAVRYEEQFGYNQPTKALEAQIVEQATGSPRDLKVENVWQHPSLLPPIIFGVLIALIAASLAYLTLNHILSKNSLKSILMGIHDLDECKEGWSSYRKADRSVKAKGSRSDTRRSG